MDKSRQTKFMELYTPVHKRISAFCYSVSGNKTDAQDLLGESVFTAFSKFDENYNQEAFLHFLFAIAIRHSKHTKRKSYKIEYHEKYPVIEEKNTEFESNYEVEHLYAALNQLPENQREAIVLFEISGFSTEEISEMQNCKPEAVRQRLSRGRERLRKLLGVRKREKVMASVIEPISALILLLFASENIQPISDDELDLYFETARNQAPVLSLEEVQNLIQHAAAGTLPRANKSIFKFKLFKFLSMITIIVSLITAVYLLFSPAKKTSEVPKPSEVSPISAISEEKNSLEKNIISTEKTINKKDTTKTFKIENTEKENKRDTIKETAKTIDWNVDTAFNGGKLFVFLYEDEMEKLGIRKDDNGFFYNNKFGGKQVYWGYPVLNKKQNNFVDSITPNRSECTNLSFFAAKFSSSIEFVDRTNSNFFSSLDSLVPVVNEEFGGFATIWWFSPDGAFFNALPERYKNSKIVFKQIKELKQKNPDKQIVDFYNNYYLLELHKRIKPIVLTDEESAKIGIEQVTEYRDKYTKNPWGVIGYRIMSYSKADTMGAIDGFDSTFISANNKSGRFRSDIGNNWDKKGLLRFPVLMSNIDGTIHWCESGKIKDDGIFKKYDFTKLLPIKLNYEEGGRPDDKHYEILWYPICDELLNGLPEKIAKEIREKGNIYSPTNEFLTKAKEKQFSMNDLKTQIDFNKISSKAEILNAGINSEKLDEKSVLDGRNFILKLTEEELKQIGVITSHDFFSSFYFMNNNNGKIQQIGHPFDKWDNMPKLDTSYYKYICYKNYDATILNSTRDTLVPVYLEDIKHKEQSSIFWFSANEEFFKRIPERYLYIKPIYERIKILKQQNPNHQFIGYFGNLHLLNFQETIPFLKLNMKELKKIGIVKVSYTEEEVENRFASVDWGGFNYTAQKNVERFKSSGGWRITDLSKTDTIQDFQYFYESGASGCMSRWKPRQYLIPKRFPLFYTDQNGNILRTFIGQNKRVKEEFESLINTMIPVRINLTDFYTGEKSKQDEYLFFWYPLSPEFVDALPNSIAEELRTEVKRINATSAKDFVPSSCTYFEACRSTLFLEEMKVYPNPTTGELNLDMRAAEAINAKISLVSFSGQEIKVLQEMKNYEKGAHSLKFNVSDVQDGMYLLTIRTKDAFKTKRVLVIK